VFAALNPVILGGSSPVRECCQTGPSDSPEVWMSRSAIPAAASWTSSDATPSEVRSIAAFAVSAWAETPKLTVAKSGTAATRPSPVTVIRAASCAQAALAKSTATTIAPNLRIIVLPFVQFSAVPTRAASRSLGLRLSSGGNLL
jgi:hypothetical protein